MKLTLFAISMLTIGILKLSAETITSPEEQAVAELEAQVAHNPHDPEIRYRLGIAYNDLAQRGDEEALEKAINIFEALLAENPHMLKAEAMLGSATVLKAKYVSIFSKLKYAKQGFKTLDAVVDKAPENADIRLIRAINSSRVPGFLGRSNIAEEDFNWLLKTVKTNPNAFSSDMKRSIYFYAGEFALKSDDESAVYLLQRAQNTPGQSRLSLNIDETLAEARKTFPESITNK